MINWYLNRLKTISIAEFPYRIMQFIKNIYERYFCLGKIPDSLTVATKENALRFSFLTDKLYLIQSLFLEGHSDILNII